MDFESKRSVRVMIISLKAGWVRLVFGRGSMVMCVGGWCVFRGIRGDISTNLTEHRGVGLNLTSANLCFLLDPWWNPAMEDQ